MSDSDAMKPVLDRIAEALDRISPRPPRAADFSSAEAFVWQADGQSFEPVAKVNRVPLTLLKGIDRTAAILLDNTRRFAAGLPANNALLWGARGMGKSSFVKAAHADARSKAAGLKLIEIHREEISSLPKCLTYLKTAPFRFIVFCDDLSFDHDDTSYKSLKAVLEGGIEGRAEERHFLRDVEPAPSDAARNDRE